MVHPSLPSSVTSVRAATFALGSLALAAGLLANYAARVEPGRVEVVRVTLPLPRLPADLDGLALAQISDIHAGGAIRVEQIRRFVAMTNALHPDITVITGDMFQYRAESAQMSARELANLHAPLGVYAIMGNHERHVPPEVGEQPFRQAGLTVLCNAAHEVRVNGASLWLVGLDDWLRRYGDLALALRGVPEESCKVLLVHEPDLADQAAQYPIDLQLSGHTHGGQVRLPIIGPLILPTLGHRYPMGLYRVGNMWVYTNRGLGMANPAVRLNCRPEIALFTLTCSRGKHDTA